MNTCNKCGNQLDVSDLYCSTCGNRVAPTGSNPTLLRSKLVAGLLGIFLGSWGVHNFYLGKTGRGIIQIVLTIITFGVAGLWGFIEGILILCDRINTDGADKPLLP